MLLQGFFSACCTSLCVCCQAHASRLDLHWTDATDVTRPQAVAPSITHPHHYTCSWRVLAGALCMKQKSTQVPARAPPDQAPSDQSSKLGSLEPGPATASKAKEHRRQYNTLTLGGRNLSSSGVRRPFMSSAGGGLQVLMGGFVGEGNTQAGLSMRDSAQEQRLPGSPARGDGMQVGYMRQGSCMVAAYNCYCYLSGLGI